MLGGLDPVVIFHFFEAQNFVSNQEVAIPIQARNVVYIETPPIPIYLSEEFFNIVIDGEAKTVDIDTTTETLNDGSEADVTQKAIQSSINISMEGKRDSVTLTLLSAMIDRIFDKVTAKEYAISYLHGATTVFRGLLQSFSVENVPGTDKLSLKFSISKGKKEPVVKIDIPSVPGFTGTLPGDAAL